MSGGEFKFDKVTNLQIGDNNIQGGQGNVTGTDHTFTQNFDAAAAPEPQAIIDKLEALLAAVSDADRPLVEASVERLNQVAPDDKQGWRVAFEETLGTLSQVTGTYSGVVEAVDMTRQMLESLG
ncbi:hypothetical protein L1785_13595 [Antribacter sp. KLBMP9083]|uniref:Uncharacterized protein n=1 Tax=Antribacter soli TaxID=2910976 RepID=A0AA41U9V7_9MICO|nr:hypothetical protein [Antribacter soli]MCF4122012.1 hypothetical protein [Antribacter soli]